VCTLCCSAATGFYEQIFTALRVPYEPVRWVQDIPEGAVDKTARVMELIDAYRTRGHAELVASSPL
jgi:multifunctional 2-oxoglutarate metabolism enzyme